MLCPTNDLVCESWQFWFLNLGKGGMVDCRPFGTLIKVLDSLLRRMPTHSQTQIFVYVFRRCTVDSYKHGLASSKNFYAM